MNFPRFFTVSSFVSAILMACVMALCGAGPASAGLITNGDFEANGDYINASIFVPFDLSGLPVPTGWTTLKPNFAAAILGIGFGDSGAFALPSHAAALVSTGGISQSFVTVADSNYTLSFDGGALAPLGGNPPFMAMMTVTLFDGAAPLASTSYVENGTSLTPLKAHSLAFKAGSGTTRLEFSFLFNDPVYDGRYFALLDNVVVSDAAVMAPEPVSWVLLLFGIGLMGIRAVATTRHC